MRLCCPGQSSLLNVTSLGHFTFLAEKKNPDGFGGTFFCYSFRSIPHSCDLHSLFPNSSAFNLIPITRTPVSFFTFFPLLPLRIMIGGFAYEKLKVSLTRRPCLPAGPSGGRRLV